MNNLYKSLTLQMSRVQRQINYWLIYKYGYYFSAPKNDFIKTIEFKLKICLSKSSTFLKVY